MTLTVDAFSMTAPTFAEPKVISEVLDPGFVAELQDLSRLHADNQDNADDDKWNIARLVNEMWDEHKNLIDRKTGEKIFKTRLEYFAECSVVLNKNRKRKYFSDSGETLRRYCELRATYEQFLKKVPDAEKFIDLATMEHLRIARSLYMNGKVKSPIDALMWCYPDSGEKKTADEMEYHFDPPLPPEQKEVTMSKVDALLSKDGWKWLKSVDSIKQVIFHVSEIKRIVAEDK